MKLISLVSTPPNIENLYLEESVDERTGNYILKPNIGESLVLNNAFGVEGFPRMFSFSEIPLFDNCYLVEGWFEHSRGAQSMSHIQLVEISRDFGLKTISKTYIDRMLNYYFAFNSNYKKIYFLGHGLNKKFESKAQCGTLHIKNPIIEWDYLNIENDTQGKNWIPEMSFPIQSISGDEEVFLDELPVSLDWFQDLKSKDSSVFLQPKVYSAYKDLISIESKSLVFKPDGLNPFASQ